MGKKIFVQGKNATGWLVDEDDYKEWIEKQPKLTLKQFGKICEVLGELD